MKRKLRLFADYMADTPLWEDYFATPWPEGEYNKSEETLKSFGVSLHTLSMMQTLIWVFETPSAVKKPPKHYKKAYEGLLYVIKEQLDREIGDKFEIEVVV